MGFIIYNCLTIKINELHFFYSFSCSSQKIEVGGMFI